MIGSKILIMWTFWYGRSVGPTRHIFTCQKSPLASDQAPVKQTLHCICTCTHPKCNNPILLTIMSSVLGFCTCAQKKIDRIKGLHICISCLRKSNLKHDQGPMAWVGSQRYVHVDFEIQVYKTQYNLKCNEVVCSQRLHYFLHNVALRLKL